MLVERVEFTADGLRQQLRRHLTAGEIAEIERAAWNQVFDELIGRAGSAGAGSCSLRPQSGGAHFARGQSD